MNATRIAVAVLAWAAFVNPRAAAQTPPSTAPSTGGYVTREEYEALKSELEAMRREMKAAKEASATKEEVDQTIEEIEKDIKANHDKISDLTLGTSKFLITGYTFAGFTDRRREGSSFNAGFNPIFLWKVSDRIFVEAEPELELETEDGEGSTRINLEYADINFFLNDYMTLRGGQILTPFGQFPERLHPAWINKLPDFPLVYQEEGGLVPFSILGFELRGAVPVRSAKVNYGVYVANGPSLNTDDPDRAGQLIGGNFSDNNRNKTVGGRVGFLPIPQLEIGYSIQAGDVGGGDFKGTSALLQGVDVSYVHDSDALRGVLDFRAEWVWSQVDRATYDPDGSLGFGPVSFSNKRNGGYVQVAYRPTKLGGWVKNLEGVCRYDRIDQPGGAPGSFDEQRVTFGLDYWFAPSAVLKAAYQLDDRDEGGNRNGFFVQAAVGF